MAQQDCDFRAQVETREGTCFNNCMFIYRLVDEHGVVINSLPANLTDVRLYYRKLNESDTIYSPRYEGGEDTVFLMAGTYVVGMEGLCELGPGNRHIIRTVDTMTLVTTYRVPTAPVINQVATSVDGIGTHPTLSCGNTGSVQLKIEGGRMPFYVNVVNESGDDTVKTVVFENPMYDGNDESKYNYKDYYTVDSLPAGTWRFYVRDACHYGMAVTVETVTTVQPPLVNAIDVYASTGNAHLTDSNVVKIRANMNYQYVYYIQELCNFMTYRIFKAGSSVNDDSWKPFPCASSDRIVLYDTLDVQNYCEVMNPGDSIHFQFRLNMEGCKDTIVDRYFHYNKPNKDKFDYKKVMEQLDLRKVGEPCEYGYWSYTKEVSIKYPYQPDNANPNDDHGEYRYHYTSPLTWTYVDNYDENDTIKKDTIRHLGESTSLTLEEAGFTLDSLDNSTVHSVKREVRAVLVDAHGCPLYEAKHEFIYELKNEDAKPTFEVTNTEGNHCCEDPRSITVKTSGILKDSVIIDTIMLIQSPLGNRYNLIATFNRSILTWVVRPLTNQIQNTTTVDALYKFGEPDGKSFTISGNCLPSGPYKFVIKTQCGSDTIVRKIGFPDVYIVGIKDMPVHNVTHECAYRYVTYSQGQFEIRKSNQDKNTGEPLPPTVTNLSTKFQVVSGPAGGYDKNTKYAIGDAPLRFSLPGTYVVKMFPENSKVVCEDSMYVFDTIVHRGAILDLEYVGALKCKEGDTEGNVYISGIYGTPPYTYTLYDTADLGGHVVVSVKVREDGTFETIEAGNVGIQTNGVGVVIGNVYEGVEGVPMRTGKELSCMIEDSCGTYFYVNFFPQTLATMQKVWFDNDLREAVVCEGDSVQVHALEYGSFFRYVWTTSSGTPVSTVANPYLSIPRESQEGVYYVTISEHGCNMIVKDSIHLVIKESPSIQMSVTLDQDTIVCPGSTVSITVVPHSNMSDSVRFSLAFSNEKGEEIRNYVGGSGVPMPIDYTVLYPTYIYSVAVEDEECGFHHPEDSVEIKTNTKDMLTNCSLMTRWDTVCAGSAAELFARDTVTPPYTLQWYHDYELTSLAQEEVINSSEYWSSYHTAALAEDTTMYVRVLKEGRCPSHQMIATEVHNIADGHEHRIRCDEVLRLYDTGGPEGNYGIGEEVTAFFRSGDHRPISLHFEELDLSVTSVLYVISGTEVVEDSLLYILRYGMDIPDVIVSRGDALTLYFTAGDNTASGWNALIQTAGSVAVAKVNKPVYTIFSDEVCQRQSGIYDDPYHVVGEIVTADTISKIVKQAGTYLFAKTYSRELPLCDSTVSFQLTVRHPDYKTPVNVITTTKESNYPYEWYGQEYNETGQYLHPIDGEGGDCDVIDVLNLVVLKINDFTGQLEICKGEEATLKVSIITPTLPPIFTQLHRVGDVLCTDNTIMHPDSFLLSGKSAKGVVFYLDPDNNNKGKAIALRDAYEGMNGRGELPSRFQGECIWAIGGKNPATNKENYESIHACRLYGKVGEAVYDMKGWGNTDTIRKTTYNLAGIDTSTATASQMNNAFKKYAPAAYYCYYYNVDSARAMKGVREKDTEGGNISPIPSGWYLPSIGEMNLYFVNRREVSRTLEKLQNTPHNAKLMQGRIDVRQTSSSIYRHDESYWTSTEFNNQEAYRLSGKGQMIYNKTDYKKNISTNNPSFVRAIIEF